MMETTIMDFIGNALLVFPLYFLISAPFVIWLFSLRQEASRLKLYRVRDRWVYLVVSGVLPKDDEIFELVYELINTHLQKAEEYTLDKYYQAMLEAAFVEATTNESKFESNRSKISKLPDEVKEVIDEYYGVSLSVMVTHSNFLRVWLKLIEIDAINKTLKLNLWVLRVLKSYREYESVRESRNKLLNPIPA